MLLVLVETTVESQKVVGVVDYLVDFDDAFYYLTPFSTGRFRTDIGPTQPKFRTDFTPIGPKFN
jgi:hypothetical protein